MTQCLPPLIDSLTFVTYVSMYHLFSHHTNLISCSAISHLPISHSMEKYLQLPTAEIDPSTAENTGARFWWP